MKIVLVVLALLLVIATALPLQRLDQWWIRVFDFPRAQITSAGIIVLALYLCFWETQRAYESIVLGLLVLAVGYQVVKMFPYTVLMPKQVLAAESHSDGAKLSLLDPRAGRGTHCTINAKIPLWRWPLDHVFHPGHFKHVHMEAGPAWGSDHFPIFIELSLESVAEAQQQEPDRNRAEANLVGEKIEDGKQIHQVHAIVAARTKRV